MIKAVHIKTGLWNKIIDQLIAHGWTCVDQYEGIDAGIDYNSYTLVNDNDSIKFEWNNWTEGEFSCTPTVFQEVERITGLKFITE